jgi:arabinogalactan oligomer/maltooligosaccharide transport system permease protein
MAVQDAVNPAGNVQAGAKARVKTPKLRPYDRTWLWTSRVIIWVAIAITLFPIFSVVMASFSPGGAFFRPSLIPEKWTLSNYAQLFNRGWDSQFVVWLRNTFIVAAAVSAITTFITTLAAFAVSRMRFPGRRYGLMTLLLLQMFPGAMSLPALVGLLTAIGGFDTHWGLILVLSGTGAFNIWLMKNFIDSIPRELDEAAMVDGATSSQIFWRVILPLAKPMIVVLFLWGFMGVLNEYIISAVVLKTNSLWTVSMGLKTWVDQLGTKWGLFAAATLVMSIPVMILWFINQRWVQQGLTQGAVKG